ncbi:jg20166 [Pararge aegeria aegeria]|uniref:acyl-CoA oxidase n=2 Tax=Pararge aegeria TaxID=116150 RepID=A0A8S4S377_9NEOP|nr:jg20166 [Pararge aegeria aegeria]
MEPPRKMVAEEELKVYFPDLPSGPLDGYRKKGTFSWRRMKLVYDNLNTIKLKHDIWTFMEKHPLFQHSEASLTLDDERNVTVKRMYAMHNEKFTAMEKIIEEPRVVQAEAEAMFMFDSSLAIKKTLTFNMFANTIRGSGRPDQYQFVEDVEQAKIGGCFALTEVAHGSNAKGMRTTATYSPEKKQFIMHSADFEAAKFWVGSLGKCSTHAIVYAMLISKGTNHGLHSFIVPIRDPKTLKPYPGVIVGDIGEKIGLNGVDNGFVMFNNYAIPKKLALDKFGGVDDNGEYKSPFRDPSKRFGASLGVLSGKCSTHAIVYAMLISKGTNHGLHSFIVPIRDPKTLKPYPGVIVGDIGEKIGLNGVDNGFVMFNNYAIPKKLALDKFGGVDDNGEYKSPFRDPSKRFGASLGVLSGGRVMITSISTNYLQKAIVIATRYSAIRKQFGAENAIEETPVLEYQQQQIRLLPYLAATFAQRIFCTWFGTVLVHMTIDNYAGTQDELAAARGIEVHALSSAAKPVCGWVARDGIQNCREACGGHGYLKASGIGDLRNENDANCTYEGENSLLLQQNSNWLLGVWPKRRQIKIAQESPLGTLEFLENVDEVLMKPCSWKTMDELIDPYNLTQMYKWLTAYMLKTTYEKVAKLKREGADNLQAKNDSQSYNAVTLSVIYGENYILNHFYKTAKSFEDEACRKVLLKMVSLYGAFLLEKHMATLYIGGYFSLDQGLHLREGILKMCSLLAPEAVALTDTLAPPDFCMKSVLGMSDGEAYKHLQNRVMTYPGALARPEWWRDVVYWDSYIPSKL